MKADRRQFVFGVPALTGLSLLPGMGLSQDLEPAAPPDPRLIEYWTQMGVPASTLPPAGPQLGANQGESPFLNDIESEPIFLYVDSEKNEIYPAQDLPKNRVNQMLSGSDAEVQIAMHRLRLSGPDHREFDRFRSAGLLFDVQQKSAVNEYAGLAWSVFSAIFPTTKPSGGATSGGAAKPAAASTRQASPAKKQSRVEAFISGSLSNTGSATGSPPLQPLEQVHTMQLPNGLGKSHLTLFMKDRKKSAFGSLLNIFGQVAGSVATSYLSLLNLGGIAAPALASVRGLAAHLHIADQQKMLFHTPSPVELVANRDALTTGGRGVRLIEGNYLVVRKGHLRQFSGFDKNIRIFDGYLVPSETDWTKSYDQAAGFLDGVSYLSLAVSVKKARMSANCKA